MHAKYHDVAYFLARCLAALKVKNADNHLDHLLFEFPRQLF